MSEITQTTPAGRRCWSVRWPEYTPADVTPPELRPSAPARHVPDGAEAAPTPTDVRDWDHGHRLIGRFGRQGQAALVDERRFAAALTRVVDQPAGNTAST